LLEFYTQQRFWGAFNRRLHSNSKKSANYLLDKKITYLHIKSIHYM